MLFKLVVLLVVVWVLVSNGLVSTVELAHFAEWAATVAGRLAEAGRGA